MKYDRKTYITDPTVHIHEKQLRELFPEGSSPVIMDIGACEGENSVRYSRYFPAGKVYTFEPIPSNFKLVQSNIEAYKTPNITPFNVCLSDKEGTAEFYVSSGKPDEFKDKDLDWEFGNKSSSLLPPHKTLEAYSWIEFKDKITVQTRRLDNLMKENGLDHIDFIHMDVQGAELMVLEGSGAQLQNLRNIWLEVEAIPLYKGQPIKRDVERFFEKSGFVKLVDVPDPVVGDQFWSEEKWLISLKGADWVKQKKAENKRNDQLERRRQLVQGIRDKVRFRTRVKSLFGK